jgi:hypothetical protein
MSSPDAYEADVESQHTQGYGPPMPLLRTKVDAAGRRARVGVDLSKRVYQVHAVDRSGKVLLAKAMSPERFLVWCREPPATGHTARKRVR